MAQDTWKTPETKQGYFNEEDRDLLEGALKDRIPLTNETRYRSAGDENRSGDWKNLDQKFIDDLGRHSGEFNGQGGLLCVVDRSGNPSVCGDTPKNREALKRAGYQSSEEIWNPLSHGEQMYESEGEKLINMRETARRDREEAERAGNKRA